MPRNAAATASPFAVMTGPASMVVILPPKGPRRTADCKVITALAFGKPLVTRNTREFQRVPGLTVLDYTTA